MKHVLTYNQISNVQFINENVQGAKAYMKKIYAKNHNISPNDVDLSDTNVQGSWEGMKLAHVLKITEKNPGYALPFLKFATEQNVPTLGTWPGEIRSITMLMDWIRRNPLLVSRLPRKIEEYANHKKIDGVNSFEKLADDIRTLDREISIKWLIDSLPIKPRTEYKNLTIDKRQELVNIGILLNELDKEDPEKTIAKRLLSKIKSMKDYSIHEISDYMNEYIKGYSVSDIESKLQQIIDLSPEAGILYNDYPYLALSMRTEKAQKKLCSAANWCINRGSFKGYAENALQINIFNYSLPASDSMFLTGTTVSYDGHVSTSHDINDHYLKKSDSPKEQFLSMGYPVNVVDVIIESFPTEIAIKKLVEKIINNKEGKSAYAGFLSHILGLADKKLQGGIGDSEWASTISTVVEILDASSDSFEPELIKFLEEYGVFTQAGLKVLDDILRNRLSKSQIDKIYSTSIETFDEIKRLYSYKIDRNDGNPSLIERLKKILDERDKILSEIKK